MTQQALLTALAPRPDGNPLWRKKWAAPVVTSTLKMWLLPPELPR